jgi:hypothetical protein
MQNPETQQQLIFNHHQNHHFQENSSPTIPSLVQTFYPITNPPNWGTLVQK